MATGVLSGDRLRRDRLRVLLGLRARLTWRLFARERGRIVGLVLMLMVLLPLALGLGFGTAIGYLQLPGPWPTQLLAGVLVALWLAWILIPLVAFSLNEGMDMTRLLVYPLSRMELIATMLLGTLFDPPTYLLLPLFGAIVVGWAASPALLLLPAALLVAYGQMVLTSQIVVTALGGLLASRRVRDVLIVLGALFGSSCYLLQRGFAALIERYVEPEQLASLRPLALLRWLPPGSLAQAIASAAGEEWASALLWLGYGLLWLLVLAWVWWQLSMRLLTGNGFMLKGLAAGRSIPKARPRARREVRERRWLPADLQQLMAKELRLVWRTPQRRVGLLWGLLSPLIVIGLAVVDGVQPEVLPAWLGLLLPLFGILTVWIAGYNALGMEGKGLPLLLLTPLPRYRFWLAKGIVTFLLTATPTLLLGLLLLFFHPTWQSAAGVLAIPGVALAALAVGNVGSIFFAYPVNTEGEGLRSNTRGGFVTGLGNGVIMPTVIVLTCLPPALILLAAQLLQAPWLGYVGGLFAIIYGAALFAGVGVVVAGRLMLQREAELVAATKPPERE